MIQKMFWEIFSKGNFQGREDLNWTQLNLDENEVEGRGSCDCRFIGLKFHFHFSSYFTFFNLILSLISLNKKFVVFPFFSFYYNFSHLIFSTITFTSLNRGWDGSSIFMTWCEAFCSDFNLFPIISRRNAT